MPPYTLTVNGREHAVEADPDTPLLWVLRDLVGLTGTKFGCGRGQCGACTVQVNGAPVRSCQLPVAGAAALTISTIDGDGDAALAACREAWLAEDVAQCGYCQAGMLMTASALVRGNASPTDAQIDGALGANVCRCGTYPRLRKAVHHAARLLREGATSESGASGAAPDGAAPAREDA
jgi:isoquinoline 1-oxidoreductase alpha subunit